jgi:hypothetical protein
MQTLSRTNPFRTARKCAYEDGACEKKSAANIHIDGKSNNNIGGFPTFFHSPTQKSQEEGRK